MNTDYIGQYTNIRPLTDQDRKTIFRMAQADFITNTDVPYENVNYETEIEYNGLRYLVILDLRTDRHFIRELGWAELNYTDRQKLLEEHKDTIPMFL